MVEVSITVFLSFESNAYNYEDNPEGFQVI